MSQSLSNKAAELINAFTFEGFSFEDLCSTVKHDILLADKVFLPFSYALSSHQAATFLEFEEGKFIFVQACRGASKTSMIARYMLLKALTWPMTGLFTAPTFRQALFGYKFAVSYIKENSLKRNPINLWNELVSKPTGGGGQQAEAKITFKNGSLLKALPMGDGEKIRGERADLLFCDEFFNMGRQMFNIHILPFLLKPLRQKPTNRLQIVKPESKLIMATSAEYEDCFAYHFLTHTMIPKMKLELEHPGERRKYIVVDWNIDDLIACDFSLEPDVIDLQTGDASKEEKARALYNQWVGISGQYFPTNLAEKISSAEVQIEHGTDGLSPYAFSVDIAIAKGGDEFIIHVWKFIQQRRMALVNSFWGNGMSPDDMANQIHEFNKDFRPELIYMDKAGGGLAVASSLAKRKLILSSNQEVVVDSPILLHDEAYLSGQKILLLNRPGDHLVREAFMGKRPSGQDYISTEETLVHMTYDGIKNIMSNNPPLVLIPAFGSEQSVDRYGRPEVEILDNIRESVHQLRHLAVKTVENPDGTREIVKSSKTKVPMYMWKSAKKDGAVTFAYGFIPYALHYSSELGEEEDVGEIIIEHDDFSVPSWLRQYIREENNPFIR